MSIPSFVSLLPSKLNADYFISLSSSEKISYLQHLENGLYVMNLSTYKQKLYNKLLSLVEDDPMDIDIDVVITVRIRKDTIPKALRILVWDIFIGKEKGIAKCTCCNHTEIRQLDFECGHVVAESLGGSTTVDNLRPICGSCNRSMGVQNFYDFQKMYFTS